MVRYNFVAGIQKFVLIHFARLWNVNSDWSDLHKEVGNTAGPTLLNIPERKRNRAPSWSFICKGTCGIQHKEG